MAYTNELRYLLEDDDKSIELVHVCPQLMRIKCLVLYYYLFTQYLKLLLIVKTTVTYVINITLIMKYSVENNIRVLV